MAAQIFADGPIDAPAKYVVPGSSEIVPVAVQAELDGTLASGDFVPTLIFRSQAGHVIARVPTDTTVAAGGSAEVSWFPGVKHAATALPTVQENKAFLYLGRGLPGSGDSAQTITSGVVTPVAWHGIRYHGGTLKGSMVQPTFGATAIVWKTFGANVITLTVTWPSFAADRYIELGITNPDDIGTLASPRLRTAVTPDGDRMTITAVIEGDPSLPTTLSANLFQASGVNQAIHAEMSFWSTWTDVTLA